MILKIIVICIVTAILSQVIKMFSPSFVPIIALTVGLVVISILYKNISQVTGIVGDITKNIIGFSECIKITLKTVAISVVCEFSSQLCEDMGEKYLASKIDFAGKIIIVCLTIPELINIINTVTDLILII